MRHSTPLSARAVGTVDDPSVPDETVAQVYQPGYKMGTKVIRPAMVTITTGGPKREKPKKSKTNEGGRSLAAFVLERAILSN